MNRIINLLTEYKGARETLLKNRSTWFYNILIAASALLGSLIALSNNSQESCFVRSLFVLTVALITLGILSVIIVLRYDTECSKRHCQEIRKKLKCIREGSEYDDLWTSIKDPRALLFFGILACIFFLIFFYIFNVIRCCEEFTGVALKFKFRIYFEFARY